MNRPKKLAVVFLIFFACAFGRFATAVGAEGGRAEDTARILIVTGEDYPGHKWKETYPALQKELEKDSRLTIDVLTDLKKLGAAKLDKYEAVILHFKNYDPKVPGRAGFDNLTGFVKQGGGLMVLHFGCGAFEEFKDEYEKVVGRVWFGMKPPPGKRQHDPRGPFTVNITKGAHPITRGMKDFETVDELYTCLEGDLPITTLATAVSKIDKQPYPIAFVCEYGKGRVFQSVLGHDTVGFQEAGPSELHRRACAWIARLAPVESRE